MNSQYKQSNNKKVCQKNKVMLKSKNSLPLVVEGLEKRIKQIGLFVEYVQCVCMKILYLVFVIVGVALFT